MNISFKVLTLLLLLIQFSANAQLGADKAVFSHADTLRGTLNADRTWWDVMKYHVLVKPDYDKKTIEGKVDIRFKVLRTAHRMQIDLQQPMVLTKAYIGDVKLNYTRDSNAYFIEVPLNLPKGSLQTLALRFEGSPRVAKRPPWDGGWIFTKDEKGRPWMSVACQGLGASVWYPCKDHQSDEPDNGAELSITVPDSLVAVGNGRLVEKKSFQPGTTTWRWQVKSPINNYNIIPYIGSYVNFNDTLMGEKGKLDLNYWVLDYNLDKAKKQFQQAKTMLRAFEYWMGPYPFYEDSYKLVDAPHLGMEHQSAVAYGNKYQNGYLGRSSSDWGLKWDFIIVHESGHEWFANNITSKDLADMWIHEGFTNYSETLFTDFVYGREAGNEYNYSTRRGIRNDKPIIGPYGVNKEGSGDMYPKSGNMLHSIRHAMNDDAKFRELLRFLNKKFYHATVTTEDIQQVVSQYFGSPVNKIFDQYLRTTEIPVLEYAVSADQKTMYYRYTNCVDGFNLPLVLTTPMGIIKLGPESGKWNERVLRSGENPEQLVKQAELNFYITTRKTAQPQ
jgi:aminopeptidase N